jgi:hypothetical protein
MTTAAAFGVSLRDGASTTATAFGVSLQDEASVTAATFGVSLRQNGASVTAAASTLHAGPKAVKALFGLLANSGHNMSFFEWLRFYQIFIQSLVACPHGDDVILVAILG